MAEFAEATEKARVALAEARAEEQAGRFGFTVSAKNFTKPFTKPNLQGNPQFWPK